MATRFGQETDLFKEIVDYLEHQPAGARVSIFLLRDYVAGTRAIQFSDREFRDAIASVEEEYGLRFPEGSLSESIREAAPASLLEEDLREQRVFPSKRLTLLSARRGKVN